MEMAFTLGRKTKKFTVTFSKKTLNFVISRCRFASEGRDMYKNINASVQ